jgi:hypothetical protein
MSSERALWRSVKANLGPYGAFVRIESSTNKGIADVAYCINTHSGWLELKYLDAWPKRAATFVKVPSLTLDQVLFLERWYDSGGAAYLLLRVGRSYMLLNSSTTRALWNGISRDELKAHAIVQGSNHLPTLALIRALTT